MSKAENRGFRFSLRFDLFFERSFRGVLAVLVYDAQENDEAKECSFKNCSPHAEASIRNVRYFRKLYCSAWGSFPFFLHLSLSFSSSLCLVIYNVICAFRGTQLVSKCEIKVTFNFSGKLCGRFIRGFSVALMHDPPVSI